MKRMGRGEDGGRTECRRETPGMCERRKTKCQRRSSVMRKKRRKLILLSHFCKEPPGVCVSAKHAAVVMRKPSVTNFN